jgi:hypothetical protein
MNVAMLKHLAITIFDVAKFIALIPLPLLISCKLLFTIVGLKFSPYFCSEIS